MSHNVTLKGCKLSDLSVLEQAIKELKTEGVPISISAGKARMRGWAGNSTEQLRVITVAGAPYDIGVQQNADKTYGLIMENMIDSGTFKGLGCQPGAKSVDGHAIDPRGYDMDSAVGRLTQLCNVIQAERKAAKDGHIFTRTYDAREKQYVLEVEQA